MRFMVVFMICLFLLSVAVSSHQLAAGYFVSAIDTTRADKQTISSPNLPGTILINEVAINTLSSSSQPSHLPWLELFNPQNQAYNLGASFAAIDNGPGTQPYYLATNSNIPAQGYFEVSPRIVGPQEQPQLYRLLFQGIPIDQVTVPVLGNNQSYARIPDGGSSWQITDTPTIGASNTPATTSVITPTPLATKGTHSKTVSTSTHKKGPVGAPTTTHSTGGETKQAGETLQIQGEKQPAWSNLHLPQETATAIEPMNNTSHASTPTETPGAFPILPGALGLLATIGGIGIYYRRRQRKAA